ncbi:MAG: NAD(P)/FAD-dependent oxidoreductase [Mariniblastus sp.]|nr:NAD(P)/FAD-dependent oxidoreductase [Mariniblastus sp.]
MNNWNVIIIGAGAAGLMAAASAAARGQRVLLLEKNKKLGVKILMSGGTRCNITHNCDVNAIVTAFGRQGKFLHSALSALPPKEVIEKIESQGVATKIESTGKIFPVSNKAIDVRDALVNLALTAGAQIKTEQPVLKIRKTGDKFQINTRNDQFECNALIVTTGGKSYPGCGTTGDGYRWAQQLEHSIIDTVPALVPILNDCSWANNLKGITIEHTSVDVWQPQQTTGESEELTKSERKSRKSRSLVNRDGSFLFTHWGFSGPAILDVSRAVARHSNRRSLELICDFHPQLSIGQLEDSLWNKKTKNGKQQTGNLLNELFPKRLAESLIQSANIELQSRNAELSKQQFSALVNQVKRCRFSINGTLGFEKAEVTAGGVNLKEIDSKTMQSKTTRGLFFAGEVLDLDGPIGGFNFQSAFSTGWLAGLSTEPAAE